MLMMIAVIFCLCDHAVTYKGPYLPVYLPGTWQ